MMNKPPSGESDRPRYPAASIMNPYIGQRYEGPDENGEHVSGAVLHVGNYGDDGKPASFVLLLDNSLSQKTAIISSDDLARHVDGLALCKSMERDRE
jgi:hypothetical protein